MPAELKLVLASEEEPDFQGWSVASGSICTAHGIGCLIIVSPQEAARIIGGPVDEEKAMTALHCLCEKVQRAIAQGFGKAVLVARIEVQRAQASPPMDPRKQ